MGSGDSPPTPHPQQTPQSPPTNAPRSDEQEGGGRQEEGGSGHEESEENDVPADARLALLGGGGREMHLEFINVRGDS